MARKRSGGRARRFGGRARRFARSHTTHLLTVGGGALAAYGIVGPKQPGWTWDIDPRTSESMADRIHNITQAIPLYGSDPNMAPARAEVATGIGIVAISKLAPKFIPSLRRIRIKLSRRSALSLFG